MHLISVRFYEMGDSWGYTIDWGKFGAWISEGQNGLIFTEIQCIYKRDFGIMKRTVQKTVLATGDFMKQVPIATCALRDRQIVSIERV